jgi:hypothetical protein
MSLATYGLKPWFTVLVPMGLIWDFDCTSPAIGILLSFPRTKSSVCCVLFETPAVVSPSHHRGEFGSEQHVYYPATYSQRWLFFP